MNSETKTYDSLDRIYVDNSLSEKEKIIFSQLLNLCSYRKRYSEENYKKFVELVTAKYRRPPTFIFSKLCFRKVPIEVRKSKSWEEVKGSLDELDKELQKNLGWDLERFGPSFSRFIERYGIVPIDFQIKSWEKIFLSKKSFFVITAPTGFGKTECFLLPIMFSLFRQKIGNSGAKQSTAVFIYPRKILIEDQASRLIKAIKILWELHKEEVQKLGRVVDLPEQTVIIGLQKQEVPQDFDEQQLESSGILKRENGKSYLSLVKCIHNEGVYRFELTDEKFHGLNGVFKCEKCGFKIFVSLSRNNHKKVISEIKNIPFILLTTFESLERVFLESEFSQFFKNLRYVVVDETHVYQSIYGLHISHILKKLFEILKLYGSDSSQLKLIFSSATLPRPIEFITRLLSFKNIEPTDIEKIERNKEIDSEILPNKYKYFLYLLTKPYEYPLKTYGLIQTVMYFAHVINKIHEGTRTVAFFDTKGSLYRLRRQYNDAERKKLVQYRIRSVHNPQIPLSHNWNLLFDKLNKTLRVDEITMPISAIHVTSEFKEQRGDIMFCTSAFELGIDDPKINTVIQYGSPRKLLSFVQRVGRGNRITEDRFFLSILDSFDPIDAFYFQNNHLLSEEAFEKEGVCVPETNKIVERIHEILLELNKEFLNSQNQKLLEELDVNTLILRVFKKIITDKKLCLSSEFINLIGELLKCPEDSRNSLLSNKINELQEEYKSLEKEIEVRNLEEIYERANEILLELEKNIERKLPKQTAKEILEGKVFSDIKTKLVSLIESLQHVDEKSQFQVDQHIREIDNNFRSIEEEYKTVRPFYEIIFPIGYKFRANLYGLSEIIMKYILNKLHEEEFNKKIIEQDSTFLKLIGLECLRNSLIYRPELGRQATRWEKFVGLLQSCFWFNISYLVGKNKFFEEYENLIEKLPYVSKSYFEESMEFPVKILCAARPREGYMVSDVFIRYFPLKVDFEYIEEQRRLREAVLDLTFKKIKETEELIEVIAYPKRKRGYEYFIKRDKDRTYNLPLQVPLKPVYENIFGYVPFCFNCFNISTNEQECENCGRGVRFVKIFGRPVFNFLIEEKTAIKKIGNLILSPIYVLAILEGSKNELIPLRGNKKRVNVRLKYPFIFPLFTPAFVVDLNFIFGDIKKQYNSEDIEIIFHSFAHALLRVVASLTGFSEETFFYSYDLSKGKIYVFERYQGGIGAIDKFFEIIKERKNEVISSLLNLVDCVECEKEDRDACPFCLWISWCKEGFRMQSSFISRKKLKDFIERYKELLF